MQQPEISIHPLIGRLPFLFYLNRIIRDFEFFKAVDEARNPAVPILLHIKAREAVPQSVVDDAQVVDMTAVGADQIGDAFLNLLARYGVLALFHEVIVTRLQHLDIIHTLQKRRKLRIAVISNIKLRKFLL